MALICQNCGSNDVVSIQGQEFCINCGSIVVVPKAPATPQIPQPAPATAPTQPTLQPVAVKSLKAPPRSLTVHSHKVTTETKIADRTPATSESKVDLLEGHHLPIIHDIKAHPVSYSLKIAAAVGLIVGLAIGGGLYLNLDRDVMLYLGLSSLLFVAVMLVLAQSALLYGLSRAQDGRPTDRRQWWSVARSGFIEVLNVDLATLIVQVIGISAIFTLYEAYIRVHHGSNGLDAVMLAIGNILLAWLLLGTLAARRIAVPAVIIGNLTGTAAIKLGWRCYTRAGGHLIIALAETWVARMALVLALITGIITAGHYAPALTNQQVAAAVGAALFISIFSIFALLLQIESRLWLKQYRQWVNTFLAAQRMRLLSGRHKKRV